MEHPDAGTPDEPVPVIAGYRDLVLIGSGMTATVWRAHQDEFDRDVAIKVLKPGFERGDARDRFEREKRISAKLGNHPHVVAVFATGTTADGQPFMSMELCSDGSLADQLDRFGAFRIDEVLDVGIKVADAVHAAHTKDILHRDIKPQNIMRSEYGPALTDFGIARAAGSDTTATVQHLTPVHSAPEAFLDAQPTVAMDVYSLGSTLYTLLAGLPAYPRKPNETYTQYTLRLERDPLPPFRRRDVPDDLRAVIERAMAKDPADRHPSARDLGQALVRIRDGASDARPAPGPHDDTTEPEPEPEPTLDLVADGETAVRPAAPTEPPIPGRRAARRRARADRNATPAASPTDDPAGSDRVEPDLAETVARPSGGRPGSADPLAPTTGPRRLGRRIAIVAAAIVAGLIVLSAIVTLVNPGDTPTKDAATVVDDLTVEPRITPTNLAVRTVTGTDRWQLSWTNNAGPAAQFVVQYRPANGKRWTVAGTTTIPLYSGPARVAGQRLCFGVTAVSSRTTQSETATVCDP